MNPCRNISNFKWVSLKMNKSERNQVMWCIAKSVHKRDTSHPSRVQCGHNSEKLHLSLDASLPWPCMHNIPQSLEMKLPSITRKDSSLNHCGIKPIEKEEP
jgi:hypothetical protein